MTLPDKVHLGSAHRSTARPCSRSPQTLGSLRAGFESLLWLWAPPLTAANPPWSCLGVLGKQILLESLFPITLSQTSSASVKTPDYEFSCLSHRCIYSSV